MATTAGVAVGLGNATVGFPLLLEPGTAVVASAPFRAEAASSAATPNPLVVHAPDAGVTAAEGPTHGVAVVLVPTKAASAAKVGVTTVGPTGPKPENGEERCAVAPSRVPATASTSMAGVPSGPTSTSSSLAVPAPETTSEARKGPAAARVA